MDTLRQSCKAGYEPIVTYPQQGSSLCMMNCHRLDHDQPGAALRIADIAVRNVLIDKTVLTRKPSHHCRDHDAVRDQRSADIEWLK